MSETGTREPERLPSKGRIILRCAGYLLRHKFSVLVLFVISMASGAFSGLPVILTERFISVLTAIEKAEPGANPRYAQLMALGFGGALLARAICEYAHMVFGSIVANRVAAEVREEGMEKYLNMSIAYFDKKEAGDAVVRLSGDAAAVWHLVHLMIQMVVQPLQVIGAAVAVLYVNWRLGLLGLVGFPLAGIPVIYLAGRIRKYARKGRRRMADIARTVVQVFAGMRIVVAYGQQSNEARRFGQYSRSLLGANVKSAKARAAGRMAVQALGGVGLVLVMLVGIKWMTKGWASIADVMAVVMALGFMRGPAKNFAKNFGAINAAVAPAERIFHVLELEPDVKDGPGAVEMEDLRESIAFEGVCFKYDRDMVLEDVSFAVPAGKSCAIVGPSGAGKSSILNLVPRFYDPTDGRVLVDGRDVREVKMASLRSRIAIVTQDPFLFNTTIAENIRYAKPDAAVEEIEAAARAAHVHDEIAAFADGYETVVGDRGLNLSGGQRQRVAIARAVLRRAEILILDEATSSLDSVAEREVQAALDELVAGRTTLVVAHRLSTVSSSDMIVVLRDGRVEQIGKHDELLENSPTYAEMWEAQQHRTDEPDIFVGATPIERLAVDFDEGYLHEDDNGDQSAADPD